MQPSRAVVQSGVGVHCVVFVVSGPHPGVPGGSCPLLILSAQMGQDWSPVAAVSWRCVSPPITVVGSGFIMFVFDSVRRVISAIVVVFILSRLLDHSLQNKICT